MGCFSFKIEKNISTLSVKHFLHGAKQNGIIS